MYTIAELFTSLQGEGLNTGKPCTFIRFSGCNLSCPWCDTAFETRMALSAESLLREVVALGCKNLILTGGEPLLQHDLLTLLRLFKAEGYWIAIETNGTIEPTPEIRTHIDYIATSPKLDNPAVYMRNCITQANEVRLVISDDSEETRRRCEGFRARIVAKNYFLSPCDTPEGMKMRETISLLGQLNTHMTDSPWRLSIQAHKLAKIQ